MTSSTGSPRAANGGADAARRSLRQIYFATRAVQASELPSIMRRHTYTGAMGMTYYYLLSGLFFNYYGNAVGLTLRQWGLMGAISSWVIAAQIFSAWVAERTGRRKVLWFWMALAGRLSRLVGIVVCVLLWWRGFPHVGFLLIAAISLSNFFDTMASPVWLSWLADIIPEDQHGSFWGRRSAWVSLATMAIIVPAGLFLDHFPEAHQLGAVLVVFALGGLLGLADLFIHGTIPEPAMVLPPRAPLWANVVAPIRDRTFRPWLVFNCWWNFSVALGGTLSTLYFIDELQLSKNFFVGTIVVSALGMVGGIATGGWSGRMVDRFGPKRTLMVGHIFWGMLPLFWIFATPQTAALWLAAGSFVGGASSTAAATAQNKLITRFPPPDRRAMYVAVSTTLGAMTAGLGALLCGDILGRFPNWNFTTLGWTFGTFQALFIISAVLRLLSALVLIPRIDNGQPNGVVHEASAAVMAANGVAATEEASGNAA